MAFPINKRQLTASMALGFLIGLPIAGMVAGFVAWYSLQRRAEELAGDFGLANAVIVTGTIEAGKPLEPDTVAIRAVPRFVTSPNTVAPNEIDDLLGTRPKVGFEKGDLLLRSAFDLAPRPPPEEAQEHGEGAATKGAPGDRQPVEATGG